jgi:hypothetical protein
VDAGSGSFGAGNDLVSGEVLFGAVKNFDDCLARPSYPFMLVPEHVQRHLGTRRRRRIYPRIPRLHEPILLRM